MAGALSDPRNWRRVRTMHIQTGVPMRTLYHWIATGKLWSIEVDGIILVHVNDIDVLKAERAA
jgi:hypothetical protein